MSGFASFMPFVGPAFDTVFNLFQTERANQISRERAGEANALIDTFNTDVDAERDAWGGSMYNGLLRPEEFANERFASSTDFGGLLSGMLGDLSGAESRIGSIIGAQQRDPMQVARDAGSFVSDIDTNAWERSQRNNIASESRSRFGSASQDMLAAALGQGRSMGDTRDSMNALRYNEGISRSNALDAVGAAAQGMRNENMQARAGLQNQAMMGQLGTNAGLAGQQAGLTGTLGQSMAGARSGVAQFQDQTQDRDQTQGFDAYMNMLSAYASNNQDAWNKASSLLGMKQQNILSQAGITAGTPYTLPQSTMGRDMAQNYLQQQAIGASRQSQKSSGGFLGVSWGCISARSEVITEARGPVPQAGVLPGDRVLGADGQYHDVVAKDCGTVVEEMQAQMVLVGTEQNVIIATPDHVLDGKPAGQWKPGDKITVDGKPETVERVHEVSYEVSGDLMLENDVPYVANGFVVHSNIGRNGLAAYREQIADDAGCELDGYIVSPENPNGVWAKM